MITSNKVREYIRVGGDGDGYARSGRKGEITDDDWLVIDRMVTAMSIIRKGLASGEFKKQHEEEVQRTFDCHETYEFLRKYEMQNEGSPSPSNNPSGGCSMGCASFFILVVIVWPLLHVVGGSYEPDILFLSVLLGVPSFIVCHILVFIALRSKSPDTRLRGKKGLWLIWGAIALILILGLVGYLIDLMRGKT